MGQRTSACVWRATPAVIVALDERFGEPVDAYVNGSQTWLRDDGPAASRSSGACTRSPATASPRTSTRTRCSPRSRSPSRPATSHRRRSSRCGTASRCSPRTATRSSLRRSAAAAEAALGIEPDRAGLVDHDAIADEWERSRGATSIVDALFAQLND